MLEQPLYTHDDRAAVRSLVHSHAWVSLVSSVPDVGLVVSHLPVILDPSREDATVLGHLARSDAELHELGSHDVVIVVEGPNGYISPSLYEDGPFVPTWNFVVAHLHGRPTLLGPEETYEVLEGTVDRFEAERPNPWRLAEVEEYARRIAPHTAGFRLVPTRVVGKAKVSQDKGTDVAQRVIDALDSDDDVHGNRHLAAAMRQILAQRKPRRRSLAH